MRTAGQARAQAVHQGLGAHGADSLRMEKGPSPSRQRGLSSTPAELVLLRPASQLPHTGR